MVNTELYCTRNDGVELCITYSTNGFKIRQIETGQVYDEAIDVRPCRFTYEETDELVESIEDPYSEAGKILLGVSE